MENKFTTSINEFKQLLEKKIVETKDKKYNKEVLSYKFFVVDLELKRAISGWEFESDAKEELENYDGDKNFKIVKKSQLSKLNVEDPTNRWINERMSDFDQIAKISTLDVDVQIEVDLKHTVHSMERQGRSGDFVKNSDIKDTVNLATEQIVHALLKDRIDINEPLLIFNSNNDLNVVGSLSAVNTSTNKYVFKVITVMFNKEFYNSKKTYKITI